MAAPNPPELTDRQRRALEYVRGYHARHGRGPSVREVGEHLGHPNPQHAKYTLDKLKGLGLLTDAQLGGAPGRPRAGLRVAVGAGDPLLIPFRGRVSCGPPAPRDEDGEEPLDVRALFKRDDLVAFRAVGQSMVEAGIFPGDYLICLPDDAPPAGRTVIAEVGGEMLCKRLKKRRGELVLEPCNGAMGPIDVGTDTKFLGVLHTVIRRL